MVVFLTPILGVSWSNLTSPHSFPMGWEKPPTSLDSSPSNYHLGEYVWTFFHPHRRVATPSFGLVDVPWVGCLKSLEIDVIIIILLGGCFRYVLFSPRKLGKISILTIFQMGWNHQLVILLGGLLTFITVNQCLNFQLIWWFGAWWFGSLRSPKMNPGLLLRGARFASQTTGPQTTNLHNLPFICTHWSGHL